MELSATSSRTNPKLRWVILTAYVGLLVITTGVLFVVNTGFLRAAEPELPPGVTGLVFAWFWAMLAAIAGSAKHYGLENTGGWFVFIVAPLFSFFSLYQGVTELGLHW